MIPEQLFQDVIGTIGGELPEGVGAFVIPDGDNLTIHPSPPRILHLEGVIENIGNEPQRRGDFSHRGVPKGSGPAGGDTVKRSDGHFFFL